LEGNEKDSITVLASVIVDGNKLPLFVIAKGKTRRVNQNLLKSNPDIVKNHSPSGWIPNETFRHHLDWLATRYAKKIKGGGGGIINSIWSWTAILSIDRQTFETMRRLSRSGCGSFRPITVTSYNRWTGLLVEF
jgi:hypothetical protein